MKTSLTILVLLTSFAFTSQASADNDDCTVPMAQWQPREAVKHIAREQGLSVRRIKIDDGCYQINGRDASGRKIEIKLNPATLEIIDIEYDD